MCTLKGNVYLKLPLLSIVPVNVPDPPRPKMSMLPVRAVLVCVLMIQVVGAFTLNVGKFAGPMFVVPLYVPTMRGTEVVVAVTVVAVVVTAGATVAIGATDIRHRFSNVSN